MPRGMVPYYAGRFPPHVPSIALDKKSNHPLSLVVQLSDSKQCAFSS